MAYPNPIRIMYLDTSIDMAGGQYSLLTLLKRLDRAEYVPILYAPGPSRLKRICGALGVETHVLPFRSVHRISHAKPGLVAWPEDILRSLAGMFFVVWAIWRRHVDVVHANTFKAALIASVACLIARKPLIFHDRVLIRHGLLGRIVARLARRIIVVSSSLAGVHGEALRGKVSLIYDGIDTDYMVAGKVPQDGDGGPGRAVCYLGRISWEKGVDLLVEAAEHVLTKIPDAVFLVGGSPYTPADASYKRSIEQSVEDRHLAPRFRLLGHIEDRRAFIAKAGVFVLPSRRESLGLVLLEAMSLEKPVVAFDIDGPGEIVTDRKEGLLVEPGDVEGLAEAIISMLRDTDLAERSGKSGRETVIARFSASTFAERIAGIYDEIARPPEPTEQGEG